MTDMTALSSADEPKRFETINFCVVSRWRRLFHVLEIEEKKESNNKAEASATWVCREICPLVDEINLETFFSVLSGFCYETSASMGDVFLFLQVA